jgi:hypothetical protein
MLTLTFYSAFNMSSGFVDSVVLTQNSSGVSLFFPFMQFEYTLSDPDFPYMK